MITIYKYELVSEKDLILGNKVAETINLPTGARVLSVGVQNNKVCTWVLLDNEVLITNNVYVQFVGTGWEVRFPDNIPNPIFVDTVSLYGGDFMYHVFMGKVNSNWNIPGDSNHKDPTVPDSGSSEH